MFVVAEVRIFLKALYTRCLFYVSLSGRRNGTRQKFQRYCPTITHWWTYTLSVKTPSAKSDEISIK